MKRGVSSMYINYHITIIFFKIMFYESIKFKLGVWREIKANINNKQQTRLFKAENETIYFYLNLSYPSPNPKVATFIPTVPDVVFISPQDLHIKQHLHLIFKKKAMEKAYRWQCKNIKKIDFLPMLNSKQ
ncbi:hypothetical protein C0J52_09659 [Blattella germanica]|nr:hypothetical protein C0J52_09659 [Blattella germanica]